MARKPFLLLMLALFAFSGISFAATRSIVGTWNLNTAKSDFDGVPKPKSAVAYIAQDSSTVVAWRVRRVDAKGVVRRQSYKGAPGRMNAVKGVAGEQWSYTRTGDNTFIFKELSRDRGTVTVNYQVSADGKTMTGHATAQNKNGSRQSWILVWDKIK